MFCVCSHIASNACTLTALTFLAPVVSRLYARIPSKSPRCTADTRRFYLLVCLRVGSSACLSGSTLISASICLASLSAFASISINRPKTACGVADSLPSAVRFAVPACDETIACPPLNVTTWPTNKSHDCLYCRLEQVAAGTKARP